MNGHSQSTEREPQGINAQTVAWLRVLIAPDQVTELRALDVQRSRERPHTVSGFFDYAHLMQMAERAINVSEIAKGVYFTMNPLRTDILARRANRIDYAQEGKLAKDADVISRRWLLIDADPKRDPHISSTDSEKAAALETVKAVRSDLSQQGWPSPVLADSGNGYHLLYRIDLLSEDGGIVERCLKALAAKYNSSAVHIDQSVYNPARICKLPGTLARKGDSVKDRPHRRAALLEIPTERDKPCLQVVLRELLEVLAAQAPIPTLAKPGSNGTSNGFQPNNGSAAYQCRLVDRWLQDRSIEFRVKPQADGRGRTVYVLKHCPFDATHGDPDSCIMQAPNGALSAHCFHNSCSGRGWQQFKEAIGKPSAEHFDPPIKKRRKSRSPKTEKPESAVSDTTALDIIREYFRTYYQPTFRRGAVLYSAALGREIRASEACFAPDSKLVDALEDEASDCPRNEDGTRRSAIPKLFKTWAPVAWRDVLDQLPEEEATPEVVGSAAEEFRAKVAAGLHTHVVLGYRHQGTEETHVERRSLIVWASLFAQKARPGIWGQVRNYLLWCRRDDPNGPLRVALRVGLFSSGQAHLRSLAELSQGRFARLCELYEVGSAYNAGGQRIRAGGQPAVELTPDFIAELLSGPASEQPQHREPGEEG